MGLFSNTVAALTALTTGFTGVYSDINVSPPSDKTYNYAQRNTDQSSMIARGANMSSGVVTIDRAKGNAMTTNDNPAHKQFALKTLGKLPVIMHAVRVNPGLVSGDNADAIGMIQGFSAQDTTDMWDEYGGISIIQDIAKRYDLQETTAKNTWYDTTMSAVDVARLIRRFMDDDDIKNSHKRWVLNVMKTAPLSVSGEDMSWGIPSAMGISAKEDEVNTDTPAVWMQGWSPSGEKPMVRHSVGMVGQGYRFIVVMMGQVPEETSNQDANRTMTQAMQELISGGDDSTGAGGITLGAEDGGNTDPKVEKFLEKNKKFSD